jgi:hypothetical protein
MRNATFWKRLLLLLIIFAPAIYTGKLVSKYAVDVGCWDMWENGPLLQKWHDGIHWSDLYAAQIQHRIVIPRLFVIALTHLSGGDFRWENYTTFAVMLGSAWLLYRLMRRTMGASPWVAALAFVANLLVFSPMLYQIFFWGSSLWMTLPMLCLLGILNLLSPEDLPLKKPALVFSAVLLLAEIATHSFAHGILFWPILVVYVLLQPSLAPAKARYSMAGITLILGAVTIICYFTNFINVAFHAYNLKPGDPAMEGGMNIMDPADRAKFVGFFFGFLGNPFARSPFEDHPLASAEFFGYFVLGSFLLCAALIVFTKTGRRIWPKALPWLALAAYVIGVAIAISKGRSSIGEHRAVTTRYLVISLFLPISVLSLAFLYARALLVERSLTIKQNSRLTAACLLTAFAMWQVPQWSYGQYLTEMWSHARRQAQALVLFLPHLKPASMKTLDKDYKYCLDSINTLNNLHLLNYKPLPSAELKWFKKNTKIANASQADITSVKFLSNGNLEVLGNARFGAQKPADAILFTRGEKVIALGQPAPLPRLRLYALDYEFANYNEFPVSDLYTWESYIAPAQLTDSKEPLELWALDVRDMRITKLEKSVQIDIASKSALIK